MKPIINIHISSLFNELKVTGNSLQTELNPMEEKVLEILSRVINDASNVTEYAVKKNRTDFKHLETISFSDREIDSVTEKLKEMSKDIKPPVKHFYCLVAYEITTS